MLSKWVSVNYKLPDEFEFVLISFTDSTRTDLRFVPSIGQLRNGKWSTKECEAAYSDFVRSYDFERDFNVKVTHWMPLPEPPK